MQDSRRSIISWALYDWGNSAFATTVMAGFFPIFFSAYWSGGADSVTTTFYLGLANSIASLVIALLAPVLGAIADHGSYRKRLLVFFAFLGAVMTAGLWFVQSGQWVLAIAFYIAATIGFSGGNTFYDSLLPSVASEEKIDYVSSLGYSMGYIGGGLLFLLNVIMYITPGTFGLPVDDGGATAIRVSFLMVAIWWLVFTIPVVLFVKEPEKTHGTMTALQSIRTGLKELAVTFREIKKLKVVGIFLLAYWCYIDGVDTIIRMAVDYGTALGFSPTSLIVALLITQFVAFPAALGYSYLGRRIGIKKALLIAIGAYGIISIMGFFMTQEIHFYILACLIGLFQGGIQALSRSYYTRLIPASKSAQFFGFFNMLGKFAAIAGPLLMSFTTILTGDNRYGILSLVILFVIGGVLLVRVDEEEGRKAREAFESAAAVRKQD